MAKDHRRLAEEVTQGILLDEPNFRRVCADRSRSAGRSALPAEANPGFSDEPAHDDDHTGEGDPEVNDPSAPLSTPHKSFLWALCHRTRPLHYPTIRGS